MDFAVETSVRQTHPCAGIIFKTVIYYCSLTNIEYGTNANIVTDHVIIKNNT